MPSCSSNFICCRSKLYLGSDNILTNSYYKKGDMLTLIGRRPSSYGIRSSGFDIENAPLAMNRILSVFTSPILVLTRVP